MMKNLKRIILVAIIMFFATQPYNYYCNLSYNCKPISLSNILAIESKETIKLDFDIINEIDELEIAALSDSSIITKVNKEVIVDYLATNNSDESIDIQAHLMFEPIELIGYFKRHECLCMKNITIKPGHKKKLRIRFFVKDDILEDELLQKTESIQIKYLIN